MDEHVFYSLGHTKKVRNFCRAVEPSKAKEQIEGRLFLLKSSLFTLVWETLVA